MADEQGQDFGTQIDHMLKMARARAVLPPHLQQRIRDWEEARQLVEGLVAKCLIDATEPATKADVLLALVQMRKYTDAQTWLVADLLGAASQPASESASGGDYPPGGSP